MKTKLFSALTITLISASAAFAAPYTYFGSLPGATFSGTGIPNNPVAVTTVTSGDDNITLGLSATSKYPNPPVAPGILANNNAGTFYAPSGSGLSPAGDATWNFDFYINQSLGSITASGGITYNLIISGTGITSPLTYNLNQIYGSLLPSSTIQDSENLNFEYGVNEYWDPGFNANADGQYTFELEALDANGSLLGSTTLNVDAVPDAFSTALLLGLGLGSLALFRFAKVRVPNVA